MYFDYNYNSGYVLFCLFFFFFNDTATTEIYTLSLHDALPISPSQSISSRNFDVMTSSNVVELNLSPATPRPDAFFAGTNSFPSQYLSREAFGSRTPWRSSHQYTSICFVLMGWRHSYCTHCVPVRGQLPYDPRRSPRELRGLLPSLRAVSRVSPETYELEGVATRAMFTAELVSWASAK